MYIFLRIFEIFIVTSSDSYGSCCITCEGISVLDSRLYIHANYFTKLLHKFRKSSDYTLYSTFLFNLAIYKRMG